MKQKWSAEWKSSIQPRKQRKYRRNAPLHVMHRFLGARLAPEHTRQFGRRSLPVRKGDEVRLMRGKRKGIKGVVDRVNVKESKVYVDGITVKKVDGSEVPRPLEPSNMMITKLKLDDKKRQAILDRAEAMGRKEKPPEPKETGKPKPEAKKEKPKREARPKKAKKIATKKPERSKPSKGKVTRRKKGK